MSDQWGPGNGDDGEANPQPPPPPPPPPPSDVAPIQPVPVEPVLTLESESTVSRSGGAGGRVLAGIVGALVLVGGTVFAVSQLGSSGPESPEEAVAELIDAASDEDVLGLLAALDPGERDALRDPVERMFEQLERLEVLDDSFALDGVAGIDLAFDDVTYRTEPIRDDLARVYFTGGTVTTSVQTDAIPIGDFVSDTLDRFEADISGIEESETNDITDTDVFLVAHNGGDGWRVSLGYTAAEAARLDAGLPLSDNSVDPIGSDSPEDAVEGLLRATADFDLRGVIGHLSPGELGALQDYAGLFVDDAAAEMASAAGDFDISVDGLDLRSEGSGDRASVFVDGFSVSVTHDGETISITYADGCVTLGGDLEVLSLDGSPLDGDPICADNADDLMEEIYGGSALNDMDSGLGMELPSFPSLEAPAIGITATKVDGDWYVAPVATGMDAVVAGLESLERSHLDAIVDFVEEMMSSFQASFGYGGSYTIDEYGEPLTEEFYGEGSGEEWEDVAPTTSIFSGSTGKVDEAALAELVSFYAFDDATADCVLGELSVASESVRYELADAHAYDYVPSPQSQDVFFAALDHCGV